MQKIIEPVTRPAGSGDGEGQLGFASYKAPTRGAVFSPEQEAELLEAFERCNGTKECLDTLVTEMGGAFKRTTISRKLKAMGLAKGKFTPRQVNIQLHILLSMPSYDVVA